MGRGKGKLGDLFASVIGVRRGPVSKADIRKREAVVQAETAKVEGRKAEIKEDLAEAKRALPLQHFVQGKSVDVDGFTSRHGRVMDDGTQAHVETSFLYKNGKLMACVLLPQSFTGTGRVWRRTIKAREALGYAALHAMRTDRQVVSSPMEVLDVTEGVFFKGLIQDGFSRRGLVRAEVIAQAEALKMVKMTDRQRKCLQAISDSPGRNATEIGHLIGDGLRSEKTDRTLNGLCARGLVTDDNNVCFYATEDGTDYLAVASA